MIDLIHIDVVKKIIDENIIYNSVANASDPNMLFLLGVWKEYFEPDISYACGLCVTRVYDSFKNMQKPLLDRLKQSKLLDAST